MPDDITHWTLPTRQLGRAVQIHACLDSTNTLALTHANDPTRHGLVILAREQTAGRGQYGRSWHAPAGSSVLMSVLLFPPLSLRRPSLLTAWAAVSVCETIACCADLDATIKWPNDVFVAGKKVCGILIEQRTTAHAEFSLATVAGIGLNVTQPAEMFERAGLPLAASLRSLSRKSLDCDTVASALIHELDVQYQRLLDGDPSSLESAWSGRLGLTGKLVAIEGATKTQCGRLLEATLDGIIVDMDGDVVRLAPEAIRHIHGD